ncbi:Methionyl-tRNA formyltransferase [Pseudobythopirellula maris]|uniref:Methionyl-tRNA formyltransferase n=1 Tax=Pseudobythopirellula maris TaxID=2527991 RepID=A0A5C5ZXB2_9BACT|nr:methionyl-tRNA formyltransferase [Pseudobythopirellula maris]TWT90923.1 Methionyl-tRNA formyltransferase [Pseudobythopirellula maris]
MRLVVMGTGPFAVPTLRALQASEHEVLVVVARPPRGRRREPAPPMVAAAEELGLPVWRPESANLSESQERLRGYEADLMVVCDYGEILKDATLGVTRLGGVNLHGSLLPKYRGAAPVQWAVLNGDAESGSTVIQMTPGLDAGPSLGQSRLAIDPHETAGELEERLSEAGAPLVLRVIGELAAGTATPELQDKSQATKAPRLSKEQGLVDWSRSAQKIKNHIRGMAPWPRAFTFVPMEKGEPLRLVIDRVDVVEGAGAPGPVAPGTVLEAKERLVVACGEGALELLDVQPAGKRRMAATDFLRGAAIKPGNSMRTDL